MLSGFMCCCIILAGPHLLAYSLASCPRGRIRKHVHEVCSMAVKARVHAAAEGPWGSRGSMRQQMGHVCGQLQRSMLPESWSAKLYLLII